MLSQRKTIKPWFGRFSLSLRSRVENRRFGHQARSQVLAPRTGADVLFPTPGATYLQIPRFVVLFVL
jgi:hypothetical protein